MLSLDPSSPAACRQAISTNGRKAERVWEPRLPLDKEIERILTAFCIKNREEMCGFVTANENVYQIKNVHTERRHNFYMDTFEAQQAINLIFESNTTVLGIWHTHPTNIPWPSARDLVGWPNPVLGWRYWVVTATAAVEWSLVEGNPLG
jgi:proteasome lid subunit RPN8/RPN11